MPSSAEKMTVTLVLRWTLGSLRDTIAILWDNQTIGSSRVRSVISCLYLATIGLFVFKIGQFYSSDTGLTSLVSFGVHFETNRSSVLRGEDYYLYPNYGYDSQFYVQLATDPSLKDPDLALALDNPAYRARRILLPTAAHLIGFGKVSLILIAYPLIAVLAWLAFAILLIRWLPPLDLQSFLRWVLFLFGSGVIFSTRFSLPDSSTFLLAVVTVALAEKNRTWLATFLIAISGLGKESNILSGVAILPLCGRGRKKVIKMFIQGVLIAAPISLWLLYVEYRFPSGFGGIRVQGIFPFPSSTF